MRVKHTSNFFISITQESTYPYESGKNINIKDCEFIQPNDYVVNDGVSCASIVINGRYDGFDDGISHTQDIKNINIENCYFERTGRRDTTSYDGHNAPRGDIDIYNNVDCLTINNCRSNYCQHIFVKANDCSNVIINNNIVTNSLDRFVNIQNRYNSKSIENIMITNNIATNSGGVKLDGKGTTVVGDKSIENVRITNNSILGVKDTWSIRIYNCGSKLDISNNTLESEVEVLAISSALNNYEKFYLINNNIIDLKNEPNKRGIEISSQSNDNNVSGNIVNNIIKNTVNEPIYLHTNTRMMLKDNIITNNSLSNKLQDYTIESGIVKNNSKMQQTTSTQFIVPLLDNYSKYTINCFNLRTDKKYGLFLQVSNNNGETWIDSGYSYLYNNKSLLTDDVIEKETSKDKIKIYNYFSGLGSSFTFDGEIKITRVGSIQRLYIKGVVLGDTDSVNGTVENIESIETVATVNNLDNINAIRFISYLNDTQGNIIQGSQASVYGYN